MLSWKDKVATSLLFLTIASGCGGGKPAAGPPVPLQLYVQSNFRVQDADIKGLFTNAGVTTVEISHTTRFLKDKIKTWQCNVFNTTQVGTGPTEVGHGRGGHLNLVVSQLRIDTLYALESRRTREKICAFAIAHEIGHHLPGGGHDTGSTTKMMTDQIAHVLPALIVCTWPAFTAADQAEFEAIGLKPPA